MIYKCVPNYYKEHQEVGESGSHFSGTVKSIVSLPMVSAVAVLVVVGSIPPGDLFFVFWQKLVLEGRRETAVLGGAAGVRLGILVHLKKRPMGIYL